ncbi:MAG: hemerythrin domain-containing protein [Cellvibrionaceae bacterium]
MHPTQSQLYADHYNHLRLLRFLEAEVDCFECGEDWHVRLPVILEIFDYLHAYPERRHHPIEEAAFELLLKKGVDNSEDIWAIRAEHTKLEELTRKASQLFTAVANDIVISKEELVFVTKAFLTRQFEHIYRENFEFYPVFERDISDKEWDSIERKVDKKYGVQPKNVLCDEYKNIYKTILHFDKETNPEAIARSINSISARASKRASNKQYQTDKEKTKSIIH